jgi:glutaminyl-tRNA synthetase
LKERCGVGLVQVPEVVSKTVEALIEKHKAELLEKRYPATTALRRELGLQLKWADGKDVTNKWDAAVLALLGPKDSAVNAAVYVKKGDGKKEASKKEAIKKEAIKKEAGKKDAVVGQLEEGELGLVAGMDRFGAPKDNVQLDPKLLEEHLKYGF